MAGDWITHVKAFAAKNGITYKAALKEAGASYTKAEPKKSEKKSAEPKVATEKKERKKREPKEKKTEKEPIEQCDKEEEKHSESTMAQKAVKKDKRVVNHDTKTRVEEVETMKPRKMKVLA
jgi:hypothetical protein